MKMTLHRHLQSIYHIIISCIIIYMGTGITDEGPGLDRDLGQPSLKRNDDDLEAETVREIETKLDIENVGVVREIETETGGIVLNETEIARENGNILKRSFSILL